MRKTEVLKTEFAFRKFACGALPPDVFAPEFDDSDWRTVCAPPMRPAPSPPPPTRWKTLPYPLNPNP